MPSRSPPPFRLEFVEEDPKFKLFRIIHVKHAAVFCGVFGILATIAVFGFGLTVFPWDIYENAVNVTALIAFFCFVAGGCVAHFLVLQGIRQTKFRYMVPAIIYQTFLMCLNGITSLIAIGEMVSEGNLTARDEAMAKIVLCTCPTIFVFQALMMYVLGKCRTYIQCKRRHLRNGQPPPIREVILFSNNNKVANAEQLSVDNAYVLSRDMLAFRRYCEE